MALTYQPQHLAWKERVEIELRSPRADTSRKRLPPLWTARSFPSEGNVGKVRVKGLRDKEVNLGYTFGGYTSAKYAFKGLNKPENTKFPQKRYEEELSKLIAEERRRQLELRTKLSQLQTSRS